MKRTFILTAIVIALAAAVFGQGNPAAPATKLKIGDMAPDFTLMDTSGKDVKLSDFRGKKNVVLAFYIFAFTGG